MPDSPPNSLTLLPRPAGDDPLVLVVEDIDEYRRVLTRLIRLDLGFETVEAINGFQAIRALELIEREGRKMPNLVVSDEVMTGMSGTDLLEVIGRRWPLMRRILLSGYTTGAMVVNANYPVLDKSLEHWVIYDEIKRYALGP